MGSKFLNLDTDPTLGGSNSSDIVVASQKAIKTYIDTGLDTKVSDVTVGGTSVVSSGTAVIPIATQGGSTPGLTKIPGTTYGLYINSTGYLMTSAASTTDIDGKTNANKPIVPSNLDYAIKVGVTTNTNTLTSTEKTNACSWLGASQGCIKRVWSET